MSKDLTRRAVLAKSEQTKPATGAMRTEVERAQEAMAESMLFGAAKRPQQDGTSRAILVLDATTSMDEPVEARDMAEKAEAIANGLYQGAEEVLFLVFRDDDKYPKHPRQLRAKWYTAPEDLARAIADVKSRPGWTQHCRALRHAVAEAEKQAIQQVVIISDAFERRTPLRPDGDDLAAARVHAARLRDLGVKLVVGYKGTIRGACPLDRARVDAAQAFHDITQVNGGYCFPCNPAGDPAQLGEHFRKIGEQMRLRTQGNVAGAQKLLEYMQTIPWDMTVAERVPSPHCASQSQGSTE